MKGLDLEHVRDEDLVDALAALGNDRLVRLVPALARRLDQATRDAIMRAAVSAPRAVGDAVARRVESALERGLGAALKKITG